MEVLKLSNNFIEIDTSRKAGELTTAEAQKMVDLVQNFDIFDSDYLYNLEEVKEEHRTNEQKQQTIDYLQEIKQAENGEESEELSKAIEEIQEILQNRIEEQENERQAQKLGRKIGAKLMPKIKI